MKEGTVFSSTSETLNLPTETSLTETNPMTDQDSPIPPEQQTQPSSNQDDIAITTGEKRKRENTTTTTEADPSHSPFYKTSLCSYFRRTMGASCSHGSACKYAHGEEELRPRPDNTWDPTSERAKKAIKLDSTNNNDSKEEDEEIMMTDIAADGDGDGDCLDAGLSKCLVHLPRKWQSDHLRKFLSDQGILFKSAKKKKGMSVGFVSFEDAEQLKKAIEELEGRSIGNKNIKVADVIPRQFEQKIKSAMAVPQNIPQTMEPALDGESTGISRSSDAIGDVDGNNDNSTQDGSNSRAKCARDVATPLAHMPYDDQLEHKKNSIMQMLKKLTRNARKACPNGVSLPEWILRSREIGGLPCELEGILESPLRNGYRNKCEFSVGYSLQGKPTVGFILGNFREGVTAVEEPLGCPNVSSVACKYATIFQEFLQQSGLPIWNRFKNSGFWRQLTVREGRLPRKTSDIANPEAHISEVMPDIASPEAHISEVMPDIANPEAHISEAMPDIANPEAHISEVMLIVQVSSVGFDDDIITNELRGLAHAFTTGAAGSAPPLPLTVLVIQDHQGLSNVAPADAPLRTLLLPNADGGPVVQATSNVVEARIHDYISNLLFSISPTAFFQVNTLAAEKLYSLAGDWAGLGPDSLLFDICCGTGTIGLTLADRVGMLVGIEMNASAVSDAHRNAEINGIKNCRFVCAKAEDVIGSLLKEYLDVPQKEGEQLNASEIRDKDIATVEVNNAPMDDVLDCSKNPSHDLGNGEGASGHSENDGQEIQGQLQKSCTSKERSTSMLHFKNVVAIVDPPRGGLHPTVIKVLRTHSRVRRLVYISCNPETLVANAIELCTPSPEKFEKGNGNRAWRKMSSAGLARHRTKSMPISEPFPTCKSHGC
ncbi:TRNA (URACIL-5-)-METHYLTRANSFERASE-like protein A [Salix koriyanagi]|uniref:tRNA (URACIL-5-)-METHYLTRANSFERASE-like protein A n=1 Tax=Salix koriyanagi TaxID=2511006 RepID=A0A9Q0YZG7_9ROSI|nr:TRNA (URACIL-5-)-METHYLTRANSFERASE-like protein A [Salix koriyanagi]